MLLCGNVSVICAKYKSYLNGIAHIGNSEFRITEFSYYSYLKAGLQNYTSVKTWNVSTLYLEASSGFCWFVQEEYLFKEPLPGVSWLLISRTSFWSMVRYHVPRANQP
ncbi:hypothetical protein VNO77_14866 [Canavalia gladiata]|uniref:Uncharacterized protein n=1 Tax=Canavalia gladiata TaxID=3824 RepID=A0AAN9LZ17_CANGL